MARADNKPQGRLFQDSNDPEPPWALEEDARAQGRRRVAGVDEAGRGPLAGPVVAAAVILTPGASYSGVTDSKLMTAEDRERAFRAIMRQCEAVSFAAADAEEIDRVNILQASLTAMTRAVDCLAKRPDFLYIDGNMPIPCPLPQRPLVKGDLRCLSVAAASIVAKVIRDRIMVAYDRLYPDYGFANHKGYATRFHLDAVTRCGPCPIHRRTFNGVQAQDLVSNT